MSQCHWYLLQRKYCKYRRGKSNKVSFVKIIYMATRHFMAMGYCTKNMSYNTKSYRYCTKNMNHYAKSYTLTANRSCRVGSCCVWLKSSITWSSPTNRQNINPRTDRTFHCQWKCANKPREGLFAHDVIIEVAAPRGGRVALIFFVAFAILDKPFQWTMRSEFTL